MPPNGKDDDEIPEPQRPPSPPLYTTFAARGIHPPTFSAFKPRDYRYHSQQAMTHVAWSCDGKRLAAVGIDKVTRVWVPRRACMEQKHATVFSGAHSDDVDYVSWNPTHPDLFCTSSQKDRRIVFWDARQSRHTQQCALKVSPAQTNYSPDGRVLLYTSIGNQLFFLTLGKEGDDAKEAWHPAAKDPGWRLDGRNYAAHVGGCVAVALDPRGRYLASGGHDSIVNVFDLAESICVRTITACESYIAIANSGAYIDICATATGAPLHRVPALAPAPTVTWHPSKYAIARAPPPVAVVSLFGLLE
ncbi:WD40-repeat-containing domain protein, partial [Mycena galericulata]